MITKTVATDAQRKPLFTDSSKLVFGKLFTDHMFVCKYSTEKGWHDAAIQPYQPIVLDPAAMVFHYAQEVFEGQKAYLAPNDDILMFRPQENAKRLNKSLSRMCMPEFPEDLYIEAENELLKLEKRWIPKGKGTSLYIRPTVIATEAAVGVREAKEYLFFIICSPCGPYFPDGFKPISVMASEEYVRAAPGGTGSAKAGGNYAGGMLGAHIAKEKGFNQIIWLDACERKYIEEMGAMNIFFVHNNTLITPALTGTILEGITRRSILELAQSLGMKTEERRIAISDITEGIANGSVTEAFAAGTAAIIAPIGSISYKDTKYTIGTEAGTVTKKLYDQLLGIQYGELDDPFGWMYTVK